MQVVQVHQSGKYFTKKYDLWIIFLLFLKNIKFKKYLRIFKIPGVSWWRRIPGPHIKYFLQKRKTWSKFLKLPKINKKHTFSGSLTKTEEVGIAASNNVLGFGGVFSRSYTPDFSNSLKKIWMKYFHSRDLHFLNILLILCCFLVSWHKSIFLQVNNKKWDKNNNIKSYLDYPVT